MDIKKYGENMGINLDRPSSKKFWIKIKEIEYRARELQFYVRKSNEIFSNKLAYFAEDLKDLINKSQEFYEDIQEVLEEFDIDTTNKLKV